MTTYYGNRKVEERSRSVQRRFPTAPRPRSADSRGTAAPLSEGRMLSASSKNMAASLQGDSFCRQWGKTKPATSTRCGSGMPERKKMAAAMTPPDCHVEQPPEQNRPWPKSRQGTRNFNRGSHRRGSNSFISVQNSDTGHRNSIIPEKEKHDVAKVGIRTSSLPRLNLVPNKFGVDSPIPSPKGITSKRSQLSPRHELIRPASPKGVSKQVPMPQFRGSNAVSKTLSGIPSILSFAADVRRCNVAENQVEEAHILRLAHNALLQWRLVNVRADAMLTAKKLNSERSLMNAGLNTSRLRDSVKAKRNELQQLKQNLRFIFILTGQMRYLEEWATIDQDHSAALVGAIEALRASTVRLPVIDGAKANVQRLKVAICSALNVMQAAASSTCLLLAKVQKLCSLATDLSTLSLKELSSLDQCGGLLSRMAAMQVIEHSLRLHFMQTQQMPSDQLENEA